MVRPNTPQVPGAMSAGEIARNGIRVERELIGISSIEAAQTELSQTFGEAISYGSINEELERNVALAIRSQTAPAIQRSKLSAAQAGIAIEEAMTGFADEIDITTTQFAVRSSHRGGKVILLDFSCDHTLRSDRDRVRRRFNKTLGITEHWPFRDFGLVAVASVADPAIIKDLRKLKLAQPIPARLGKVLFTRPRGS